MNYDHFGQYIASFSQFEDRLALTIRPFLKIEHLTYSQLQKRVYQTAHWLLALDIEQGDRVMIMATNSPQWVELFLACQLIGCIAVPVDASAGLTTARQFVDRTDPKLIFRNSFLHPELDNDFKTYPLENLDDFIAPYAAKDPKIPLDGNKPALIVFTSGTTADPKGVILTQKNILSNVSGVQRALRIDANWRLLSVLPLSHMYELTGGCLSVLSKGASVYYVPRVSPLAISKALNDYRITTILAIPQLLILLYSRIQQTAANEGKANILKSASFVAVVLPMGMRRTLFHSVHARLGGKLSLAVTGGAPIPIEVATAWERMGVKMIQGYGLTETAPILAVNRLNKHRLNSAGLALDNVKLRIGKDNEIQAKGPNIFKAYLNNEKATQAVFTDDGWFKTGDTGTITKGWLRIQGRLKFAIVLSSGLKVFPEDIEVVAAKHAIFKAFCIVGKKDPDGESVQAIIITDATDIQIQKEISAINDALEPFQHINSWRRWPDSDFPRTRLLKIDRRKVQEWSETNQQKNTDADEKTLPRKDPIIDLIRLCINNQSVLIKDDDRLTDIGLDSLRRLNLVALIEEQLGKSVPEEQVTNSMTVKKLKVLVEQGVPAEPPGLLPRWPFYGITRLIGNGLRESVLRAILRIWVNMTIDGRNHLRELDGPAIFIFNHTDDFDAPVVYQSLPRAIRKQLCIAMADDVINQHRILAFIGRLCFASVNFARKEPYLPSLERIGSMIDQGWNVAIAPEGQIRNKPGLQPFKLGIGLLAVNLGVPIVPVKTFGLVGTVPLHSKWPKKHSRVLVRIGRPIRFSKNEDYDQVTQRLYDIMRKL